MALAGIPKQVREGILKSENMSGKLSISFFPKYHSDSSLTATDGGTKYGSDVTPSTSSSEVDGSYSSFDVDGSYSSFTFVNFAAALDGFTSSSCTQLRGSRPLMHSPRPAMHALTGNCGRSDGGGFDCGGTTRGALFCVVPDILIVTIFERFANFALNGSDVIFCPCICSGQPSID